MRVEVKDGDVNRALKRLDRLLKADGLFRELRRREHARSKSTKVREKHAHALKRTRRKAAKAAKLDPGGVS